MIINVAQFQIHCDFIELYFHKDTIFMIIVLWHSAEKTGGLFEKATVKSLSSEDVECLWIEKMHEIRRLNSLFRLKSATEWLGHNYYTYHESFSCFVPPHFCRFRLHSRIVSSPAHLQLAWLPGWGAGFVPAVWPPGSEQKVEGRQHQVQLQLPAAGPKVFCLSRRVVFLLLSSEPCCMLSFGGKMPRQHKHLVHVTRMSLI